MTFVLRKQDIREFPFAEVASLPESSLEDWAIDHSISAFNLWMLPQLQTYFGSYKVTKNENGKLSPKQLFLDNIKGDAWAIGIWKIATKLKRSTLVKTQVNPAFSEHSALVPLILAGLKKHQNIKYMDWDREGLEHFMSADLYEAATFPYDGSLTADRLLELRTQGLTTKTGPNAGVVKKATSSWCLTGLQHTEVKDYPKLTMTMLSQIWVAHPTVRSPLMILDPVDWDSIPAPLVAQDVLPTKATKVEVNEPW